MRYYVYRHGWNAANQSAASGAPNSLRVATVEASSEREACDLAAQLVTVYNGQFLSAENADEADAREADIDARVVIE